jgi:hypothetical protein
MSETPHSDLLDLSGLPSCERAARYRELADLHLRLGQAAILAEARASHLELAALWTRLAAQAERQSAEAVMATYPDGFGQISIPNA